MSAAVSENTISCFSQHTNKILAASAVVGVALAALGSCYFAALLPSVGMPGAIALTAGGGLLALVCTSVACCKKTAPLRLDPPADEINLVIYKNGSLGFAEGHHPSIADKIVLAIMRRQPDEKTDGLRFELTPEANWNGKELLEPVLNQLGLAELNTTVIYTKSSEKPPHSDQSKPLAIKRPLSRGDLVALLAEQGGRSIKQVTLNVDENQLSDKEDRQFWLAAVIYFCPNLKRLNIGFEPPYGVAMGRPRGNWVGWEVFGNLWKPHGFEIQYPGGGVVTFH